MSQNMSLGSNGVDRVRLLRKIPTRLCGTNLSINCISSAILYQSSWSNGTFRNVPKHVFGVKCGGSGAFIAKNSDATSYHKFVH
jgi:hypothetical protein